MLQLGQAGESILLMQWRCLFRPMWPVRSWISSEAWAHVRSTASCSHFLEGIVLSIALICLGCNKDLSINPMGL